MRICEKLTVKDGWLNGFTCHRNGNHGGPLTTPAVKELLEHTMVGNLWHTGNADNGDPNNPYTDAQLSPIAQILGLTSRPEYGRFALQVTDSPDQEVLGTHRMGGAAWGAHSCPDAKQRPNHTRSRARAEIVRWAMIIRQHGPPDQHF